MELFADLGQRKRWEVFGQKWEQGAAQERQIRQEVGVAAAGTIFTQEHVAAPVVADFHPGPVPANQCEPLAGRIGLRFGTGKIVAGFVAGDPGFFDRPFAAQDDQGAGKGEVGGQGFDGKGVEPADFCASVARF